MSAPAKTFIVAFSVPGRTGSVESKNILLVSLFHYCVLLNALDGIVMGENISWDTAR